jgi:hypothetical protein
MQRFLIAAAVCVLSCFRAVAAPISCSSVGTLNLFLLANFAGCSVDDKVFTQFTYNPMAGAANVMAPGAMNIAVSGVTAGPGPGLMFSFTGFGVGAGPGITLDAQIVFTVTDNTGQIVGASLSAMNLNVLQPASDSAQVRESLSNGRTVIVTANLNSNSQTFAAVNPLTVTTDVILQTGNAAGAHAASIGAATLQFQETPEPSSSLVVSFALAGLLWLAPKHLLRKG